MRHDDEQCEITTAIIINPKGGLPFGIVGNIRYQYSKTAMRAFPFLSLLPSLSSPPALAVA